ncbi:MAG: molybdopterin-dependent oxidoreductase [Deltaproteobacteria bacterium]|nr:molybdopterin-dependent oxidoreductase [Deltaproteobacteria bacterium]
MSLGRRGFLQFCLGAGAGITFSPLPWKLMDDSCIWSQTFRGLPIEVPVPPVGEVNIEKSVCTLCPGGCGISVRKVKNRAVKIEGTEGHPINDGGICILGVAGLYQLYGGARVKGPLKRAGNRGEGKWEEISWSAAISEISKKLSQIRRNGSAHTVACISGKDRGTVPQLFKRLLTAYGSPNFISMPSSEDTEKLGLKLMQGENASVGYDLENARYILSFGSGLIDGWGSPVRVFRANSTWREEAAKGNAKVVQIEPRLSNTAAKADVWVPIVPGTEAALALGLAHVIIKERRYNKNFVMNHCFGFEDWTDDSGKAHKGLKRMVLKGYSPNEFMAIYALNALVGNINKTGGVLALPEVRTNAWPAVEQDTIAKRGVIRPRFDRAGTKAFPATESLFNQLPELLNTRKGAYDLSALLVYGANPYYTAHNRAAVAEALDSIPFIVSFASHMDETAQHADFILPSHINLEQYEDVPTPVGLNVPIIGLSRPVVDPEYDTQHVGDTVIALGKSIDGVADSFVWDNYKSLLRKTMGEKWNTLVREGYWKDPSYKPSDWARGFKTPSGKFEFLATGSYKPVVLEGDPNSYPLVLIPIESTRLADGAVANPPYLTKTVAETVLKNNDIFVEINPKTAAAYGLSEGTVAMLKTPSGEVKVRAHLYEGVRPDVVAIPTGLGHSAYDDYLSGKGVNANDVIGMAEDPVSGLDIAWGSRASLVSI